MVDVNTISTGLRLAEDGIWYATDAEQVSYPSDGHDNCMAVEEASFWFGHRNQCIVSVVAGFHPEPDQTIFDVGGGNGFVAKGLREAGFSVALVEPGQTGATNAKSRGLTTVICATTGTAGFKPGCLPAVGLFDVIEHTENDVAFLESIKPLVAPSGRMYATVPAYSALWSATDIKAGHYRRYTRNSISGVFNAAGFEVDYASYIFRPLVAPIFLTRAIPFRLGFGKSTTRTRRVNRDHAVKGGAVAGLVQKMLAAELNNLREKKVMRFGASIIVAARKA